jgi:hypothetical protein
MSVAFLQEISCLLLMLISGANLATMAAAMIYNPKLLAEFAKEACGDASLWDFPEITQQVP